MLNFFDAVPGVIASNLALSCVFIKRALLYQEPVGRLAFAYFFTLIWQTAYLLCLVMYIRKIGMIYIDAEVLREGNDATLNNLEEGVIILKTEDLKIQFQNKAADKVKRKMFDVGLPIDTDSDIFTEESAKIFAKIDDDLLKLKTIVDTNEVIIKLKDSKDAMSFKQIITQAATNDFPEEKLTFKLLNQTSDSQSGSITSQGEVNELPYRFLQMRIKKQNYLGSDAIALHIKDSTSKIRRKIKRLHKHEKKQTKTQTESFTATVSHEMRTPI